jgi:hypothetical protein
MQIKQRNNSRRLGDEEIKSIFMELNTRRLPEIYDNSSLADMHEFLVDIFRSSLWKSPEHFDKRNTFIQSIKLVNATDADHRRVFLAMADAGNAHAVISYLHMVGRKEGVFLKGHQALVTTDDVAMMVKDSGKYIAPVIHFLCRASVPSGNKNLPKLWRELSKAYDPSIKNHERFLEGMQTLVARYGIKSLGIGEHDVDHGKWVDRFLNSNEMSVKDIASAVVAGQLVSRRMGRQELVDQSREFSSQMRLVNDLGFDTNVIDIKRVVRSHNIKPPTFRLTEGLTM